MIYVPLNGDSELNCSICPLAKQVSLSFTPSQIESDHAFKLIHLYIWGPLNVETLSGAKYFLTILPEVHELSI